jgi:cytochrome P450
LSHAVGGENLKEEPMALQRVESTDARAPDLLDPRFFEEGDFHEAFRILRREDPVHWHPGNEVFNGFWSLTKSRDITFASLHPEIFISSKGINGPGFRDPSIFLGPPQGAASIIQMDPPRHVKMRRLVNKGFTRRAVNALEPQIRGIANEILDGVADTGSCDFVVDVSAKLPLAVICGLMGVEREAWPLMFDLTNRLLGSGDPEYQEVVSEEQRGTLEAQRQTAMGARMGMVEFFRGILEQRRKRPGRDLVTTLMQAEIEGEKLTDFDILAFCFLLILAGNETTRNAISGGMIALGAHDAERVRLQADPSLIDTAVEEILRWTSPLHHMSRAVTADVEVGGKTIRAGDRVLMWYASANRDEDVFEEPYRFDIGRDPNDHLAFGIAEHFCLGAGFARKEIRVMFEELFRRLPDIKVVGAPVRLRSNFINGIKHLPVAWSTVS